MLYRAEIVAGRRVVAAQNYRNVTQPRQAMRRIVESLLKARVPVQFMTVYILNEEGQVWMFALRRSGDTFEATEVQKTSVLLPKATVVTVFAGNASIYEVVGGE